MASSRRFGRILPSLIRLTGSCLWLRRDPHGGLPPAGSARPRLPGGECPARLASACHPPPGDSTARNTNDVERTPARPLPGGIPPAYCTGRYHTTDCPGINGEKSGRAESAAGRVPSGLPLRTGCETTSPRPRFPSRFRLIPGGSAILRAGRPPARLSRGRARGVPHGQRPSVRGDAYRPIAPSLPLLDRLAGTGAGPRPAWRGAPAARTRRHRVLTWSCGTGPLSRRLADAGLLPSALDASPPCSPGHWGGRAGRRASRSCWGCPPPAVWPGLRCRGAQPGPARDGPTAARGRLGRDAPRPPPGWGAGGSGLHPARAARPDEPVGGRRHRRHRAARRLDAPAPLRQLPRVDTPTAASPPGSAPMAAASSPSAITSGATWGWW